jgi:hypothetical protein
MIPVFFCCRVPWNDEDSEQIKFWLCSLSTLHIAPKFIARFRYLIVLITPTCDLLYTRVWPSNARHIKHVECSSAFCYLLMSRVGCVSQSALKALGRKLTPNFPAPLSFQKPVETVSPALSRRSSTRSSQYRDIMCRGPFC